MPRDKKPRTIRRCPYRRLSYRKIPKGKKAHHNPKQR